MIVSICHIIPLISPQRAKTGEPEDSVVYHSAPNI